MNYLANHKKTRPWRLIISILVLVGLATSIVRFVFLKPNVVYADSLFSLNEGYGASINDTNGAVSAGTITGATWKTEDLCRREKCLFFDGSGDKVAFSDDVDLDFTATNKFTITGWFRHPTIATNPDYLVTKHESGVAGGYKIYMDSDGDIAFAIDDDGTWGPEDVIGDDQSKNYDDNQWHFITAVKDGTTGIYLYVDGVLIDSDTSLTASGSLANAASFYIGIDADGSSNAWEGFIDEVQVVRKVLSAGEIMAAYLAGNSTSTGEGPVAYWRFDENTGSATYDTSSNANNSTTWGGNTTWATGKSGSALSFDGTDDVVRFTETSSVDLATTSTSFTLTAWFKTSTNYSTNAGIIAKYNGSGTLAYALYLNSSEQGVFNFADAGSHNVAVTGSTALNDGGWHHIAGVRNVATDTAYLYVDGILVSTANDTTTSSTANNVNISIGNGGSAAYDAFDFNGQIDEVKIYNYARSNAQAIEDMVSNPPPGTSASFGPDQSYLSNGLVGYWKMDEASWNGTSNEVVDSSGNSYHGVRVGNATTAGAKFGNGASLDGTGDYVNLGNDASVSGANGITISSWVYTNGNNDETIIARRLTSAGATRAYSLATDFSGTLFFTITTAGTGASSNASWNTGVTLAESSWQHIVANYDGPSATARIFVNGVLQATNTALTTGNMADSADVTTIGASNDGNFAVNGKLDDLRVYNRALSPVEVAKLYAWAPGPVGYWKMDENTGQSAYDSSGNGNTGTLGSTTFADSADPTWSPGKYGGSGSFDASDDVISVTDNTSLQLTQDVSITGWIYTTTASNGDILTRQSYGASGFGFMIWSSSLNPMFYVGSQYDQVATADIPLNQWVHVAVVKSGVQVTVYLNGAPESLSDTASATITPGSNNLEIGNDGTPFDGKIDDVHLYNYARTPGQIIEDMNAGHPSPGSPIGSAVAHWKFDEGYGSTANDQTVNDNDLTLTTNSWTNNGKFGKAWNGTGGAVRLSRSTDADLEFGASEDFTISIWYKSDSASNPAATEYLVNDGGAAGSAGYAVYANTSGFLCFGIDDDASWGPDVASCTTSDVYDNTWHHITAVRNTTSDTTKIYIDAVQKDSDTDSTTATLDSSPTFFIGDIDTDDAGSGEEFAGDIDEVKIFRSALTVEQIKLLYNQSSQTVMGALSTDSSNNPSWSANDEYCPPGQGSTCSPPLAHWKLDDNTGISAADVSTNGLTGTWSGATTGQWTNGKLGAAGLFDGSDDYIDVTDHAALDAVDDDKSWTISGWINPDTVATEKQIIGKMNFASNNTGWGVDVGANAAGQLRFIARDGASFPARVSTNVFTAGTWQFFTITHIANSTFAFYRNAQNVTSTSSNITFDGANANNLGIGRERAAGSDYDGLMDDIRIYDYVRTPAQIAWDYNRGGPVGWWKMDESLWNGTSNEVKDSSGNASHGVRSGDATTTTGKYNNAGTFDGTGDYVTIAESESDGKLDFDSGDQFSVSLWINPTSLPGAGAYDTYVGKNNGDDGWYFQIDENGKIEFFIGNGANFHSFLTNTNYVTAGSWQHIAFTQTLGTDSTALIYYNGASKGYELAGTNDLAPPLNNYSVAIGANGDGSEAATGKTDDFKIFNYILTPQQIKNLMNEGSSVRFGP